MQEIFVRVIAILDNYFGIRVPVQFLGVAVTYTHLYLKANLLRYAHPCHFCGGNMVLSRGVQEICTCDL
jgi:hypothetical protein